MIHATCEGCRAFQTGESPVCMLGKKTRKASEWLGLVKVKSLVPLEHCEKPVTRGRFLNLKEGDGK